MGLLFTSPVALAGLNVCSAVSWRTNNALSALSKVNHIDTTSGVALCPTEGLSLDRCKWIVSRYYMQMLTAQWRSGKWSIGACSWTQVRIASCCGNANSIFSTFFVSFYICASSEQLFSLYLCIHCRVSGAVRSCREFLYRTVWFTRLLWALLPSSCIMFPLETAHTVALFII